MSNVIDISSKLNFDEKQKIKITEDLVIEINDDAENVLRAYGAADNDSVEGIVNAYHILVSKEDAKKVDALKIPFNQFIKLCKAVFMAAVSGSFDPNTLDESDDEEDV